MGILSGLNSIRKFVKQVQFRKSDQTSEAISSVSKALHASQKYFLNLDKGAERSIEKEQEISDLWERAAEPVRRVDAEFSRWCRYKAMYWISRDSYSKDDIKQLNIGLEQMNKRMFDLMDDD